MMLASVVSRQRQGLPNRQTDSPYHVTSVFFGGSNLNDQRNVRCIAARVVHSPATSRDVL